MVIVDFDIKPQIGKSKPRTVYKFSHADWDSVKHDSLEFNKSYPENSEDISVDENLSRIKSHLKTCLDEYVHSLHVINGQQRHPLVDK